MPESFSRPPPAHITCITYITYITLKYSTTNCIFSEPLY
jgi:hypothetical protein